ncbi:Sua5/YciO/YrdC/YwlC family protein [Xylanimonas cellulosilytica DSM 15894]|uniref:Threonylcarbamoyl-AMP synthase n=1 Tax=Xylanimonas cellulosilytica (strain DSM 15894 / JCM 12276 / CECT 5975 / KCTC 9989 / LMG 20990 / NBRC 107835 / XIL07) TaxID=446471 RepID=D1BV66_XYLCX|nr:L-threonylcarbamoyladenylate synthase [Xylanimonas cellulosilytica]ACZ31305.1 Sua5/YciO/YrdC/YwlC family protein [Xylanimonas cellulosilytica DSM 15894]
MTVLLHADQPDDVAAAAGILRAGGIVALPTETVYGLAGDALDPAVVGAIYAAKGRPSDNPLIVHVAAFDDLPAVVRDVPGSARALAEAFWPGPLTMVLPRRDVVPDRVTAGLDTVAVRVPAHEAFRAVLRLAGVPLAAPSANQAGSPSPTTAEHVLHDLDGRIPAVLDGGPCTVGVESTVVDLTSTPPRLLRPGGVSLEELRAVLGDVDVDPAVAGELAPDQVPGSPGMKYRHYAPAAPVVVVDGPTTEAAAWVRGQPELHPVVLCSEEEAAAFAGLDVVTYGSAADPASLARGLFGALRSVDRPEITRVFARCPADDAGIARAVRNRLLKAAAFRVVRAGAPAAT